MGVILLAMDTFPTFQQMLISTKMSDLIGPSIPTVHTKPL